MQSQAILGLPYARCSRTSTKDRDEERARRTGKRRDKTRKKGNTKNGRNRVLRGCAAYRTLSTSLLEFLIVDVKDQIHKTSMNFSPG